MAPPGADTPPLGTEMPSTRTCAFRKRARRRALAPRLPPHRPPRRSCESVVVVCWFRCGGANEFRENERKTSTRAAPDSQRRALENALGLGAMSDTTPWWERPSTQPADGGDDGCSISTSVTVRPREPQDTHQFRSSRTRRPESRLRPSRLTLTLSSGLLPAALVQDRARRKRRDASQVRTHHAQVPHMSRKVRPPHLHVCIFPRSSFGFARPPRLR